MNWEFFAAWFNRFGMIFEFVSFWLATPEIIGEDRLLALERKVASYTKLLKDSNIAFAGWLKKPSNHTFLNFESDSFRDDSSCVEVITGFVLLIFVQIPIALLTIVALFLIGLLGILLQKLLERLANNQTLRRTILLLGIFMYIFGFILQLIATL